LIAYVIVRSGNAPASWKNPLEQSLRDHLEEWLRVRPRFKEFAVGHPLLLLGFALGWARKPLKNLALDGRILIVFGMLGPISIINTFCHLHSPLALAYERSVLGLILGGLIGAALAVIGRSLVFNRKL
jgi:hypothetical protein